ncbi:single-stranded DNA-binding protein [Corynebacterium glutamicum]|uniref:single-stranded DNA-binding protein n=1 Tax=Corynebacterium glutamicum TaxID=1718 RepID=UPI00058A626F|nr:single-stranded DNA-binding protein [Corynebacterium glutamicum]AJE68102.1 single-stranded DNA-binding protein [Corynebacterium glutamicum]OKX90956.1 single-stranded DNA-binding protein [Corynebacterium glutamicum]TWS37243.1 single-stranded DNA-binding protein [Corynebacterium glutamicum]
MINSPVTIAGRIVSDSVYIGRKDNLDGVLRIRVASSRSYKQGEKWHNVDKVFINVEAWGKLGINSHISLKPGVSVIVQGFLYTNEWEVQSADPNAKKLEKRQEIRMRATSIGIDLNHYIVGFKESKPNASNNPEGVEMPDANFEDYPEVDQKRGAKHEAASDASEADEAPEAPEEKRELAMAGVGAGSGSDSGEEAPF